MAAVKVRVTNPMHGGDAEDINSPLAGDSTDLGDLDGLQQRPKRSTSPTLSPRPGEVLPPRIVEIEGDDKVWQIDMNMRYPLGSQEWYLQQRRKDKEDSGEIKVEVVDRSAELDAMEMSFKTVALRTWATLSSGGNLAAGLASALHVNIYLLALGLLLSSPYMGIMTIVRLAVMGTAIQQAYATFFSSYKHFNITNADTLPAAIFVNMLTYAVEMVENENQVKYEAEMGVQSQVDFALRRGDTTSGVTGTSGMAGDLFTLKQVNDSSIEPADLEASFTPRLLCISDGGTPLSLHLGNKPYVEYGCYDQAASTILVLIMITTMSVGAIMTLLGSKFNAGPLISFVPITVQCAFLAGCGGSIFKKGVFFMVDVNSLTKSFGSGAGQIFVNLGPVIGMSVFILYAEEKLHHTKYGRVALPGLLVFLTLCFYAVLLFYFLGQSAATDGYTWTMAMQDAQDPEANEGRSYLPPLSDGRGWLMSPNEIDGSGKYHPLAAFGTLYLPQFTHFRLYHYIINPNNPERLEEFTTRTDCEACSSEDDAYVGGCIWVDANGVAAGSEYPQYTGSEEDGECHHQQFKWVVHWGAIFNSKQVVNLVVITIVTLLAILLNSAAIEEETERDVEFDQELRTVGTGNVFSGMMGGFVGFSSVGKTMLCYHLGGKHHSGVFAVAYYAGFWFLFYLVGRFVPLPVLGAFICAIGLELLIEQTWHMRHKVSGEEMFEIVMLLFVMIFSFVGGFALGMFVALVSFTAKYTSTPVIKTVLNGDEYQAEKLRKSVIGVYENLMSEGKHVSTLVLDFRMVESIDATAVKKLKKLLRYTDRVGVKICFTNLTTKMVEMFEEEGVHELRKAEDSHGHGHGHDDHGHGHGHGHEVQTGVKTLKIFEQSDAAVEWACDQLLHTKKQFNMMLPDPKTGKFTCEIIFRNVLTYIKLGFGALVAGEEFDSATFREYGEVLRWKKGQVIVNQGAGPDKLYFITEGSAAMTRRMEYDGSEKRLEKKYRGTMCCEIEFFLRKPMHYSLVADSDEIEILVFSREQFTRMEEEQPHIAEKIMTHVMEKMSETIKRLTRENHLLLRDNREQASSEVLDENGNRISSDQAKEDDELYGNDSNQVFFANQAD